MTHQVQIGSIDAFYFSGTSEAGRHWIIISD